MKFTKMALSLVSALVLAYSANASAEIINIDATKYGYNSTAGATVGNVYSLINYDPWGGSYATLQVTLAAGDYTWSNASGTTGATFSAYSFAWGASGTNVDSTRWAWDFAAFDNATNQLIVTGGITDAARPSNEAAAQSLAASLTGSFTLTQTTTLNFAIRDYFRTDNAGGVSLNIQNVSAVPEQETFAMILAGLGVMGFVARRQQKSA